jgi:hypothetical protein
MKDVGLYPTPAARHPALKPRSDGSLTDHGPSPVSHNAFTYLSVRRAVSSRGFLCTRTQHVSPSTARWPSRSTKLLQRLAYDDTDTVLQVGGLRPDLNGSGERTGRQKKPQMINMSEAVCVADDFVEYVLQHACREAYEDQVLLFKRKLPAARCRWEMLGMIGDTGRPPRDEEPDDDDEEAPETPLDEPAPTPVQDPPAEPDKRPYTVRH